MELQYSSVGVLVICVATRKLFWLYVIAMNAKRGKIVSRNKEHDHYMSIPEDFLCKGEEAVDARSILSNPCLSLYCLDLEKGEAVFVETPRDLDLTELPFLYVAQYYNATHVVSVSFDAFHEMAALVDFVEENLVFIYSVGRCGSTLVSKAFAALPNVRSLSEPDVFTQLADARAVGELVDEEVRKLGESCVRMQFKSMVGKTGCEYLVVKFRSQCLEIADLLAASFSSARRLYLTRDPISWLGSAYRAFVDPELVDDFEYRQHLEDFFVRMYPLVRDLQVKGEPMAVSRIWILNWIANVESYQRLRATGIDFYELDFSKIKADPHESVREIFDYCGVSVEDWECVAAQLSEDSQAGSSLAQGKIRDASKLLPEHSRLDAVELLKSRRHL